MHLTLRASRWICRYSFNICSATMFVNKQRTAFVVVSLVAVCVLLFILNKLVPLEVSFKNSSYFTIWTEYEPRPPYSQEWYNQNCFGGARQKTIENIGRSLKIWSLSKNEHCRSVYVKFYDIFKVEHRHGQVRLPKEFVGKVENWFGGDKNAESLVKDQTVIHISNVYIHQQTIVTPLRAKRPVRKSIQDPLEYVMSMAETTRKTCDFCNFRKNSAEDIFGRLESEHAFTASNTFKMDKWHGLIVPKVHNFINLTLDVFIDLMQLAKRWTETVHDIDNEAIFPILGWDNTEHAGASQFHPHIHAFMDSSHYYEIMENFRWGAQRYSNDHDHSNYFTDMTLIHHALGLAVTYGNATAIVELTERGDCEFVIMSPSANDDLYTLFFFAIRTIMDDLKIFSYSMVMVLPIMGDVIQPANMPAFIRVTTRGEVNNIYTDISGFDLFLTHNTVRDPYVLVDKLRNVISAYEEDLS